MRAPLMRTFWWCTLDGALDNASLVVMDALLGLRLCQRVLALKDDAPSQCGSFMVLRYGCCALDGNALLMVTPLERKFYEGF